eukprot:5930533-Pyramimonas_sp.AAC.1
MVDELARLRNMQVDELMAQAEPDEQFDGDDDLPAEQSLKRARKELVDEIPKYIAVTAVPIEGPPQDVRVLSSPHYRNKLFFEFCGSNWEMLLQCPQHVPVETDDPLPNVGQPRIDW